MNIEEIMEYREEKIYKESIGNIGKGIYALSDDIFTDDFNQTSYDPRWLTYGIFECEPTRERETWVYITSGMSNSQQGHCDENGYSGLGIEFTLETKEQSKWAILILQRLMAYNILLFYGKINSSNLIDYGHRIALNLPTTLNQKSEVKNLIVWYPTHFIETFELPSGNVDILHFVGVTDSELEYAKKNTTFHLVEKLTQANIYPLTILNRNSIL